MASLSINVDDDDDDDLAVVLIECDLPVRLDSAAQRFRYDNRH